MGCAIVSSVMAHNLSRLMGSVAMLLYEMNQLVKVRRSMVYESGFQSVARCEEALLCNRLYLLAPKFDTTKN